MPSIQARLIRPVLRATIGATAGKTADFPSQRAMIERSERFARRMDRSFTRREEPLGEIPSQWITTPKSRPDMVILYFHGGGFCLRTPVMHGKLLARLCTGSRTTGLMPDYRLVPEHPFPAAYEDGLASYTWLLDTGYAPEKIVLAGDSAGGALTMGTMLQAREAGLPLPACAVMLSPGLGVLKTDAKPEGVEEGPVLSLAAMRAFRAAFAAHRHPEHPLTRIIDNDFAGLPPLLFQVGDGELLLDDSVQAAAKAEAAGVEARLEIYPGMMHVFQMFNFLPEARRAIRQAADFIGEHLPSEGR
jgi:monoterpene epsilon-lactone hydrolase